MPGADRPMILAEAIAELRAEYAAETPVRLHGRGAATLAVKDWQDGDEGGIGAPFTAAMLKLLSHRDWYGSSFLARESIMEVADWCAARHPNHRRPLQPLPLCGWLLHLAVRLGQEPKDIVWLTQLPLYSVDSLLRQAARHALEWQHEQRHRASRIVYDADHGAPVYCPECAA